MVIMGNTKTQTTDQVVDGQLTGGEVPDWAVADPADQQVATFDGNYATQWRRPLTGAELLQYAASQVTSYEDDDPRMALEMATQIANALTMDDVLAGADTTKGKEILDTILEVDGIKFSMSTEAKGCPYFALLSARDTATSERHVISVGGWRLVLQLAQIHYITTPLAPGSPYLVAPGTPGAIEPNSFPVYFRIRQKATGNGNTLNYLARTVD